MNVLTENYFETLADVLTAIEARLVDTKSKLACASAFTEAFQTGGVPYGKTAVHSAELYEYKGRATRKYAHASVYRLESGRYELTFYVL